MPINSFLYPGASGPVVYEVANSLRFEDGNSDTLSRTPSSSGNRKTWTWSGWIKRSELGRTQNFFSAGTNNQNYGRIQFNSNDNIYIAHVDSASTTTEKQTTQVFRDISSWYHIVWHIDTTQSTASNREKLYVNGAQITDFSTNTIPAEDYQSTINEDVAHYIGTQLASYEKCSCYFAEVVFLDGTAATPTSFGEFDEDSPTIWKPKNVSGLTFGTNGFYLEFEQSGTSQNSSGLGADTSGNDNHFAVSNLTAIDQSTDTCTNNFCTLNPLVNVPYSTYSEGNTFVDVTSTGDSSHHTNYGTIAFNSGKWYWEAKALGGSKYTIGLSDANNQSNYQQVAGTNLIVGNQANSYVSGDAIGWYSTTLYKNGSTIASSLSEIVTNDIMMVAVDADNGKIYFGKNGTWRVANSTTFDSAQHDTTFTTGEFYVSAFSNEDCDWSVNWGSPSHSVSSGNADANSHGNFEYAVPSGYFALCTKNLAEFG
jgi:hypothetical protein